MEEIHIFQMKYGILLNSSDACFKGPTTTVPNPNAPRSVAVTIRQKFELYANIRPIKTYSNSKLQLDFICVREATEGLVFWY